MRLLLLAITACFAAWISAASIAHSGGLDASGCHGGSRPYHCHRSASEMVKTATGHNRLRCDLGSRSSECSGTSNSASSTFSYGSGAFNVQTYRMQSQLKKHCSGLSEYFVDGHFGPVTQKVLKRFQRAYGLQVDGIFGPKTATALNGTVRGSCSIN